MLHSIKNMFAMVVISLLLTACAHIGYGKKDIAVIPTTSIIAFNQYQVNEAINNANLSSDLKVSEISLSDIPLLNFMKNLFGLNKYIPHRAIVIGYPYECGGMWYVNNYSDETLAAKAALRRFLRYDNMGREKHVSKECGARLVLVDKKLLIRPEELPDKFREAYVCEVKSSKGEEAIIYGSFQYQGIGSNLPLLVFNKNGEKICDGRYSLSILQAFLLSGKFEAKCPDSQLPGQLQGDLSSKSIPLPDRPGIGLTISKGQTSDGGEYRLLIGISINDYEKYKRILK